MRAYHEFGPFFETDSRILILGSFPSVKSREESFYYAHPQNRFWRVLASCFGEDVPLSLHDKKQLLRRHGIALWDVIESCDVDGSSDASIKNAVPADIRGLLAKTGVERIILNGRTAEKYYLRFFKDIDIPATALPSTSPANASWSIDRLADIWREALENRRTND